MDCEAEESSITQNYTNSWANLDHPHTTRQGGVTLEEYNNTIEIGEVHRERTEDSGFGSSYNSDYAPEEISTKHTSKSPLAIFDHPHTTGHGEICTEEINQFANKNNVNQCDKEGST